MGQNQELAGFGLLINALNGGGDKGSLFPESDAKDLANGAKYIPDKVTQARRDGQNVKFVTKNGIPKYWEFENGTRINH